MNRDFISISGMEGELMLSHKKQGYGLTVTSKEFIIQKPHTTYYLKLDDVESIVPTDPYARQPIRSVSDWSELSSLVDVSPQSRLYRIRTRHVKLHNRSGIRMLGPCDFILPISDELLRMIGRCSGMSVIE